MNHIMRIPYVKGGRSEKGADCYGIVRMVRSYLGLGDMPLLSEYAAGDYRKISREKEFFNYSKCAPHPGAIAACYLGRICTHFGIVIEADGRIMVLDSTQESGPRLSSIASFESQFSKVEYYDN